MSKQFSSPRPRHSWLFTVLASLALTAQFVVAFAPLAEGRQGRSMSAHVEAAGNIAGHYSHDDAKCASCQARSIHGTTAKPDIGFVINAPVVVTLASADERAVSTDLSPQTNPRAPPSVI